MNNIDKALYELFSDKTLSEGCRLQNNYSDKHEPYIFRRKVGNKYIAFSKQFNREMEFNMSGGMTFESTFKILWHEPQLHDVFRVAKDEGMYFAFDSDNTLDFKKDAPWCEFTCIQYNPTLSLIAQSDETKQALIDLFSN